MIYGKAVKAIALLGGTALVLESITDLIKAFAESGLSLTEVAGLLVSALGTMTLAFVGMAAATNLMDWTGIAGATVILGGMALVLNQLTKLLNTFSDSGMGVSEVGTLLTTVFLALVASMKAMSAIAMILTSNPLALIGLLALVTSISAILLVMKETLPTILDACSKFIQQIGPTLIKTLQVIFDGITQIIEALGDTLPPIINSVGNLFNSIFNGISNVVNSIGTVIIKILREVKSLVTTVLTELINFIYRLGPAINSFVDEAIQAVTKLINFIVSAIEYAVNIVVDGMNGIINAINSVGDKVGFTISNVGKVSLPRFIPRLAVGGIINMPRKRSTSWRWFSSWRRSWKRRCYSTYR